MDRFGHSVSLALSIPAIWVGLLVSGIALVTLIKVWDRKSELTREQKFILGIFISFVGGSLDSGYWLIPWSLDFVQHPNADAWFYAGFLPNIFFRNICDLLGGFLHLMALIVAFGPKLRGFVIWSSIVSFAIGIVFVGCLIWFGGAQ